MITPTEMMKLQGSLWTDAPIETCTLFEALLWNTASELGSMLELTAEDLPKTSDIKEVAPAAIVHLRAVDHYFASREIPRPVSLLLILLRLDRLDAGLSEQ